MPRGEIACVAYVLARNGRSVMGDLRYLADTQIASFKTPLARGQIAALALLGDRGRSQAAFAAAVQRLRDTRDDGAYRPDYGSRLRDGAGLLALASETNAARDAILPISRVVEEEHFSLVRRTSTQENAWMVLAAQALLNDGNAITLAVDGAEQKGAFFRTYKDAALAQKPVTIANRGAAAAQVVLSVTGNPTALEPAISQGYTVERSYFRLDGTPANLEQVRQNERFATVLKVTDATAATVASSSSTICLRGSRSTIPSSSTAARSPPSLAQDRSDAGTRGIPGRSVRRRLRPRVAPAWNLHRGVHRACGGAGRYIHPPALGGHVRAGALDGRPSARSKWRRRGRDGRRARRRPSRLGAGEAGGCPRARDRLPRCRRHGARPGSPARPRTARSRRGCGPFGRRADRDGRSSGPSPR